MRVKRYRSLIAEGLLTKASKGSAGDLRPAGGREELSTDFQNELNEGADGA
jgi:hypothetical protein